MWITIEKHHILCQRNQDSTSELQYLHFSGKSSYKYVTYSCRLLSMHIKLWGKIIVPYKMTNFTFKVIITDAVKSFYMTEFNFNAKVLLQGCGYCCNGLCNSHRESRMHWKPQIDATVICHTEITCCPCRGLPPSTNSKSGIWRNMASSFSSVRSPLLRFLQTASWFSKVRQLPFSLVSFRAVLKSGKHFLSSMWKVWSSIQGSCIVLRNGWHLFLNGLSLLLMLWELGISLKKMSFGAVGWKLWPRPMLQWWIRHREADPGNNDSFFQVCVFRLNLHKLFWGELWVSPPPKMSILSLNNTAEWPTSLEGPELQRKKNWDASY